MSENSVTALDIVPEPDAIMIQHAQAANDGLRSERLSRYRSKSRPAPRRRLSS
jgi:hypothetical protein